MAPVRSRREPRPASNGSAGRGEPVYHFDKAAIVVSLDADFLCGPGSVRYQKDFAGARRVTDDRKDMNRLYVGRKHALAHRIESRPPARDACRRCRGVRA